MWIIVFVLVGLLSASCAAPQRSTCSGGCFRDGQTLEVTVADLVAVSDAPSRGLKIRDRYGRDWTVFPSQARAQIVVGGRATRWFGPPFSAHANDELRLSDADGAFRAEVSEIQYARIGLPPKPVPPPPRPAGWAVAGEILGALLLCFLQFPMGL